MTWTIGVAAATLILFATLARMTLRPQTLGAVRGGFRREVKLAVVPGVFAVPSE